MKIYIAPPPIIGNESKWHCQRGEKIVRDGLAKIPEVEIVDNEERADVVLWDYRPHNKGEKSRELINKIDPNKLCIIDWTDEFDEIHREDCLVYFKRSWVLPQYTRGLNPVKYSIERPANWYPFAYCGLKEFESPIDVERNIDVGCFLRPSCDNRSWVLSAVSHFKRSYPQYNIQIGAATNSSRSIGEKCYFDQDYLAMLKRCKILVTCEPGMWTGDTRLYESISNKCLTFTDKLYTPIPNQFVNNRHVVEYMVGDYSSLQQSLVYYLKNYGDAGTMVASNGYDFFNKYHQPKNRMEYVTNILDEIGRIR